MSVHRNFHGKSWFDESHLEVGPELLRIAVIKNYHYLSRLGVCSLIWEYDWTIPSKLFPSCEPVRGRNAAPTQYSDYMHAQCVGRCRDIRAASALRLGSGIKSLCSSKFLL